jgi:hypothetical protein
MINVENWIDVDRDFRIQRLSAPKGPLVNSEYYTGWMGILVLLKLKMYLIDD